jgi:hypothetical protein
MRARGVTRIRRLAPVRHVEKVAACRFAPVPFDGSTEDKLMSIRVITMHKTNPRDESGILPPPDELQALIEGMGRLVGDIQQAGLLVDGDGLRPSSTGVRLTFRNGERTIRQGPFTGSNELIDRYLAVRVRSIDEAIDWATRFVGPDDAEVDIRPFTEEWDLGGAPKPADVVTTRYMIARKADARSESGEREPSWTPGLLGDMTRTGVLLGTERIQPSAQGKRVFYKSGERRILDGPFTESKELIGGYLIMRVNAIDDVWPWLDRFAACFDHPIEIDVRPLYE